MKILLAGDSWGCGVWVVKKNEPAYVIHRGIEQFMLDDKHEIVNISMGASSNISTLNRITRTGNNLDKFDYVFVIESSPLRDVGCLDKNINSAKWFNNYEHLVNINNNRRFEFYSILNSFGKDIYLLGGCSTVDEDIAKKFNNIKVLIPSIPKFLSPEYIEPEIYVDSWIKHVDDRYDLETLDKLIEQQKKWFWLNKNCSHFKDDHAHPDRHGYEKVYNYIKENVLNEQNKGS